MELGKQIKEEMVDPVVVDMHTRIQTHGLDQAEPTEKTEMLVVQDAPVVMDRFQYQAQMVKQVTQENLVSQLVIYILEVVVEQQQVDLQAFQEKLRLLPIAVEAAVA